MRRCTSVVETELRDKHALMREDPFVFLRATFYRWIQIWPEECQDLRHAPKVLAVADLHVDSFGTWRDAEGRLAWGVDDFDEAYPLPYTNDLVRLAASAKIVIDSDDLRISLRDGCDAILAGYEETLRSGGTPIVLAEQAQHLELLGADEIEPPAEFWRKVGSRPTVRHGVPIQARRALEASLPDGVDLKIVRRVAGVGSLGQRRYVAIADWEGGCIAREAKAMVPSACTWLAGRVGHRQSYYQRAIAGAIRSPDPFQRCVGDWLVRRLSPDSNPIEMANLPARRDEDVLLRAMGKETANVHLGSPARAKTILTDLHRRRPDWLRGAAKAMAKANYREWKDFKTG